MNATLVHTGRTTADRRKILLAGLLGMTLLVVMGRRLFDADEAELSLKAVSTPPEMKANTSSLPPAAIGTAAAAPLRSAIPSGLAQLPEVDMNVIMSRNPFRSGGELASPGVASRNSDGNTDVNGGVTARSRGSLADSQPAPTVTSSDSNAESTVASPLNPSGKADPTIPLSAVITGGTRPAALIGDKLLYVDDLFDDQWRIIAIHSHGIVVQPIRKSSSPSVSP